MSADDNDDGDAPHPHSIDHASPGAAKAGEHESLKYHLLGPSLTKAGQDAVDQKKVDIRNPHLLPDLTDLR